MKEASPRCTTGTHKHATRQDGYITETASGNPKLAKRARQHHVHGLQSRHLGNHLVDDALVFGGEFQTKSLSMVGDGWVSG